jgi:alkanesulfonate monooxygenase SsuD/methylene tetrahydromethanopterin reductase-like flavin-dependent oxidoreductase (luciferase family)
MRLSISVEGLFGLNWTYWKALTQAIEQAGFASQYISDHFTFVQPPDRDSLEAYTALTYLADHSQRVDIGTLVSPLSVRDPVMMTRQAGAINDLSGGRMVLGMGCGWQEREHTMFGYSLGDLKSRIDRFEEGLEVITRLTRRDEPVTFEGKYFQLREARLLPRPEYPLRLLVGGNGKQRILPLVARYADIWNAVMIPAQEVRERNALLDDLLVKAGRSPSDLRRTIAVPMLCYRNDAERERIAAIHSEVTNLIPPVAAAELDGLLRQNFAGLCGTPDQVIEQLHELEAAGIEEVMWEYITPHSLEPLHVVAEAVLPYFNRASA